jgi:hypothetical protein
MRRVQAILHAFSFVGVGVVNETTQGARDDADADFEEAPHRHPAPTGGSLRRTWASTAWKAFQKAPRTAEARMNIGRSDGFELFFLQLTARENRETFMRRVTTGELEQRLRT